MPTRLNVHWWLLGGLGALLLTAISLPADFSRQVLDVEATERAREVARQNTPPVYSVDHRPIEHARSMFEAIDDALAQAYPSDADPTPALRDIELVKLYLRSFDLSRLVAQSDRLLTIQKHTLDILGQLLPQGIVLGGDGPGTFRAELGDYFDPNIATAWPDVDSMRIRVLPADRLLEATDAETMDQAIAQARVLVADIAARPGQTPEDLSELRHVVLDLVLTFITPNLVFNSAVTRQAQEANAAAVKSVYRGQYRRPVSMYVGTFVIILLMGVVSAFFLTSHAPGMPSRSRQMVSLGVMLLIGVALSYFGVRFVHRIPAVDYPILMLPLATTAALASMLLGTACGVFSAVLMSGIIGMMAGVGTASGVSVVELLALVTSGLLAAYTTSGVHHRQDLVIAGAVTTVLSSLMVLGAGLVDGQAGSAPWGAVAWAVGSGVAMTAVVPGLLPPFEYLAGTATDLELLDLSDLNHPLLVQLQKVAPGTFNHSLNVSRLAEAAAEMIGANCLLARVGAYYHDIGKMSYPQYFIENQEGGPNPHDRLTPSMSARVVIAHVKDGIELAMEHKLPRNVVDLIPEHHGTSLIRVFYHKAVQQGDAVDEADFRYPGPRPQSKVGAVTLLADSIEAAATARFRHASGLGRRDCQQLVSEIVNQYMRDGQLNQCDLTLRDVALISDSFERTLVGMYHSRIDYPKAMHLGPAEEEVHVADETSV